MQNQSLIISSLESYHPPGKARLVGLEASDYMVSDGQKRTK